MKQQDLEDSIRQLALLATRIAESLNGNPDLAEDDNDQPSVGDAEALKPRTSEAAAKASEPKLFKIRPKIKCTTEPRGYATPQNKSPTQIVLDASEGFIPLWSKNVVLRWRFNEQSMYYFQNVEAAKNAIRALMKKAILKWGDATPVGFKETNDAWDFEVVMESANDCSAFGCTLAAAFFPDGGRHQLYLFPKMFEQTKKEQIDTLIHEIGHIFGLRHFFALLEESEWPSEVFGDHKAFSIMNYGNMSELTETDRADLKNLYQLVWSGDLTEINGTPIRLFEPYHSAGRFVRPNAFAARAERF